MIGSPLPAVTLLEAVYADDPITDRPTTTLDEQCLQASRRVIDAHPDLRRRIDGLYFGTMGMFAGETRGRRLPSQIPNFLRGELHLSGLRAGTFNSYTSTSESGGVALLKAFRDLEEGWVETALVVAGEQMFSVDPAHRGADRAAISQWIRGVLDPREADPYELSMLAVGDLLMDHAVWASGLDAGQWREILETVTLDKYRAAALYPHTMQAAKEARRGAPVDVARYRDLRQDPWVSPHFRRDDVCASANGATALLLTTRRDAVEAGRPHVRILGMGEGHTSVCFSGRAGAVGRSAAIRRSLRQLCRSAGLHPDLLRGDGGTAAILHDAFPSIELAFLVELAANSSWRAVIERYLSRWSNPLGGLTAGGHALGNSGLYQCAKARHLLAKDERWLGPHDPQKPDAGIYLLTNVGSALTSVVTTLVADTSRPEVIERVERAERAFSNDEVLRTFAPVSEVPLFQAAIDTLAGDEGIIAARTRTMLEGEPRWIYLVHGRAATLFTAEPAPTETPWPIGARVRFAQRGCRVMVTAQLREAVRAPVMSDADTAAVSAAVRHVREGRLRPRLATTN